jgi:N-acyl-D-aspartate/D-glutamate deacylase
VQVHSRALNTLLSFQTQMPFDKWDVWRDLRALPLAEQKAKLGDASLRAKLVEVANGEPPKNRIVGVEARPPSWKHLYILDSMLGEHKRVADVARARAMDPVELMIELSLETDLRQFFIQPVANENQDDVLEMIQHPRSVVTFSDSGAHVSQIMDSSLQTHLLAHWVREKQALTLEDAVGQLTHNAAIQWGMHDRGLVREGLNADLVVFDPDTVGPAMPEVVNDLPAGAKRLKQVAVGIKNTVVNGQVFLEENEHTGAHAGRLFRGLPD